MDIDFSDFTSVIDAVRSRYPATFRLQITFNGFYIDVFTNSLPLKQILTAYFHEFIVETPQADVHSTVTVHDASSISFPYSYKLATPSAPHKPCKHEWIDLSGGRIVHHRITDMHYFIGNEQNCMAGPCLTMKNQVVNFINSRFIKNKVDEGYLLGHASAVELDGHGMIISGNSGAGKSTLALHMVTAGANFVSNDRVLINKDGTGLFFGTAQQPRINPGTALNNPCLDSILSEQEHHKFESMPSEQLWTTEIKYDALIPTYYGANRFIPHAPLSGVVIMDWERIDVPVQIKQLSAQNASYFIKYLMKKNDLLFLPENKNYTDPTLPDYIQALRDIPIFILQGGVNFADATQALLSTLKLETQLNNKQCSM